jgi:carboxyl-terminal processing protease
MQRTTRLTLALLCTVPLIAAADKGETFQLLNLFGDVFERVRTDYVEEVKDADLIEAAINGMLTSLDPHSGYMNEKAFKEMQVQTKGEFGGLGIEVTMENGLVKVVSPIDDTPAYKAGVKAGDFVSHINDDPVMGMTLSEAVDKMRGPVDSKVKLTILREDMTEPLDLNITRAVIKIKSVRSRVEGDIGYVRITSFTEQTNDLLTSEVEKLRKDIPTMHGLVIDLRNNPGGLLDQAVAVSDDFLSEGEIVSTRERDPNKTKRYSARDNNEIIPDGMPVVVLINNGSASASEIVSGALKDHKRAIIMGTKSFGKGSVQTVIPLSGHGAIRLTTSRYYTPSGVSIQAKGITPDIEVQQAKIEAVKSDKIRLEADLRRRLKTIEEKKAEQGEKKDAKKAEDKAKEAREMLRELEKEKEKDKEKDKDKDKDNKDEKGKKTDSGDLDPSEDFQLQRALDLLHGLDVYQQLENATSTATPQTDAQ